MLPHYIFSVLMTTTFGYIPAACTILYLHVFCGEPSMLTHFKEKIPTETTTKSFVLINKDITIKCAEKHLI